VNLPIGILGFFMASIFLFDSPYQRKPTSVDWSGIALMVVGFGTLQLMLDQGEREDRFESPLSHPDVAPPTGPDPIIRPTTRRSR